MADAMDTMGILYQNLQDAGFDQQTIKRCISIVENGSIQALLPLLSKQKTILLDNVHIVQKQIDCLDYLLYKIQKEND